MMQRAAELSTKMEIGPVLAVAVRVKPLSPFNFRDMTNQYMQAALRDRSTQLGIPEQMLSCALFIIRQNRHQVNAIDHGHEMDEYIYCALLQQAFTERKARAEADLYASELQRQLEAEKELSVLKREELTSDAFYRAVLPLMVKVLGREPMLRLHAEEASKIVLDLAEIKRRHRATSLTEIIVKRCPAEIEA